MKNKLRRTAALLAAVVLLSGWACNQSDFERNAWVTIRDADAAIESATGTYERWRDETPRQFTDNEIEQIRQSLNAGNEALSAAEASFAAYRSARRAQEAGQASDIATAESELRAALDALTRAVASIRAIIAQYSNRSALELSTDVQAAAIPFPLIVILMSLLGEFAAAALGGKKGAITRAATELIAAVLAAHQQATGEDIDLAAPALRARIEARRKRLAKP